MIDAVVALACVAVMVVAGAFHVYWGLGGKVGHSVSLPQREDGSLLMAHSAIGAHFVGVAMAVAAWIVIAWGGWLPSPVPNPWLRIAVIGLAVVFAARALSWYRYVGLFKSVRHTRFAGYDTYLYSPLCLFVAGGLAFLLLRRAGAG